MANAAYLPIVADRYGALVRHIFVEGLDLTGIDMRAQVRWSGDSPGAPMVDLLTVINGNQQGLRLVEVLAENFVPISHVEMVINESTMEGLPYGGEIGDATQLAWDWQITIAGRKRRLAKGEFEITGDGVTGAESAPLSRPLPSGFPRRPVTNVWSSARLTFGEEQVTVKIDGADLLATYARQAQDALDRIEEFTTGPAGPSNNTRTNLAALKAAATTDKTSLYDGSLWTWTTGDFSGQADDVNIVKATSTALNVGAWVRQGAGGVVTQAAGPDATRRPVRDKLNERVSLPDFIRASEGSDHTQAFARAFAALDTAGGKGATLYLPSSFGAYNISAPIVVPDRVKLIGDGARSTIINAQHDGAMIVLNSVTHAAVRGLRLGMGQASVAIDIATTSISIRLLDIDDIEIAGAGASKPGQVGMRLRATGTDPGGSNNIITECRFGNLYFFQIDRPVQDYDTEGNHWHSVTIDQFCYTAGAAFDARGLANFYIGMRMAGAPAAGSIGYKQFGLRNHATIITDIGNSATAVSMGSGGSNITHLQRPRQDSPTVIQTPIGNIGRNNTVIEGGRVYTRGSQPSSSNFTLTRFGTGATVSSILGDDNSLQFTVTAGTGVPVKGPGSLPRVTYGLADGVWPFDNAVLNVNCTDGVQTGFPIRTKLATTTSWMFDADFQPVTGESYVFQAALR